MCLTWRPMPLTELVRSNTISAPRGISLMMPVGDEPSIYTFSDDPDWVRDNLRLPFKVHVRRPKRRENKL